MSAAQLLVSPRACANTHTRNRPLGARSRATPIQRSGMWRWCRPRVGTKPSRSKLTSFTSYGRCSMSSGNAVFQPDVSAAAHWRLFRLLPTGIEVLGDASFEEWGAALSDLTRVQGNIQWWIGDMLAYGEARYGEKYVQAVEATGYAAQSLMNMVSVAARVPAEVRKPAL